MSHSSHRIAVLLPVEAEYPNRLLEGAIAYGAEHPEITLIEIPYTQSNPGASPLPAEPPDFDGTMVWLNSADTWVERLRAAKIPVVNTSRDWEDRGLPMVVFNRLGVEKLAFDHLATLGRKQIAYIGIDTSHSIQERRRKSFLDRAAQRSLDVAAFEIDFSNIAVNVNRLIKLDKDAARLLQNFLADLPKPAAVWCDDDYVARIICDHAAREGVRVPEDLAVLGLGDYSAARHGKPSISTIPQPGQLVGRRALKLLHRILDGKKLANTVIEVPPPPVLERESTRGGGLADERFQRVRREIRDRACEGLTVADLVKMLPMSQVTFSKHFACLFGRSPGEEIRHVKAEQAKHYLRSTTLSVERIADLCGFESQGNFSKFFKRQTGRTATEYRREKSPGEAD